MNLVKISQATYEDFGQPVYTCLMGEPERVTYRWQTRDIFALYSTVTASTPSHDQHLQLIVGASHKVQIKESPT